MNNFFSPRVYLFLQFFQRDLRVYGQQVGRYLVNNTLIYPAMYAFTFAYLQANTYFAHRSPKMSALIFSGNIIVPLMVSGFNVTFDLFFDLQSNKRVSYQITLLSPRLVLLQRLLFAWFFCCMITIPFYPIAKLMVGDVLDTSNTHWPSVILMVVAGALFCASYQLLAACVFKRPDQIRILWSRVNLPMLTLGGFFIPRYVIHNFSPFLGKLVFLNPVVYLTDGIRQAIIGGPEFLPVWLCVLALSTVSVACFIATCYVFKKRVDHI